MEEVVYPGERRQALELVERPGVADPEEAAEALEPAERGQIVNAGIFDPEAEVAYQIEGLKPLKTLDLVADLRTNELLAEPARGAALDFAPGRVRRP